MIKLKAVAAAALIAMAGAASVATAQTVTTDPLPGSFAVPLVGGPGGNVTGGQLYADCDNCLFSGQAREPQGSTGTWLAVGPANTGNGGGPATLTFGSGITGVSFLWGSPDTYNSFSFLTTAGPAITYTAQQLVTALGGGINLNGAATSVLVTFRPAAGAFVNSITFSSTSNALEIGQVTAVPEPGTIALMLAGLGVVGFLARRRGVLGGQPQGMPA